MLVYFTCCAVDEQEVVSENSPWWLKLRTTCSEADNISAALMAALVGRSVALEMAQMGLGNSVRSMLSLTYFCAKMSAKRHDGRNIHVLNCVAVGDIEISGLIQFWSILVASNLRSSFIM